MGNAGVFAFYPNKQITTGEGGVVVTRDEALARRIRALRNQGRYESDDWFQHTELGYNYRISEINCALGLAQMARLEEILQKRADVASPTIGGSTAIRSSFFRPLAFPAGRISWFVYVVRLNAGAHLNRDAIMREFEPRGYRFRPVLRSIHLQPSYAAWRHSANLAVTEAVASRTLALPFFNNIEADAIDHVCVRGPLRLSRQAPELVSTL